MSARRLAKGLLILLGTVFVGVGVLGVFVPLLPTTPFLLLAAACYVRSSQRFYDWLLSVRWLGEYIRRYREGRGIPLRARAVALILLWGTIGYSVLFIVRGPLVRAVLTLIAIGVTAHILSIRTSK
ncbi:MAG: hypothetical protein AMJ46_14435 [Latescibacteria bacterium DG_63]|nr:MAG: hypothetical protein AMJ46_14435 [Latescibacteria bacterium DG_63]